jgi:hypothetical protein
VSVPQLPFAGYLRPAEMAALLTAATNSGLVNADRQQRTKGIKPGFVAGIPIGISLADRLEHELITMNGVERLLDGTVPLAIYLSNCAGYLQLRDLPGVDLFASTASRIGNAVSGVGSFTPTNQLVEIVQPEAIVGRDEMLDYAFLALGHAAGRSVGRIAVPRFDDGVQRRLPSGQPWLMLGTAWILADSYVLTNHHVVNARTTGEPAAGPADVDRQACSSEVEFDFDAPGSPTIRAGVTELVAMDQALDYALLKVDTQGRTPLRLAPNAMTFNAASWIPVNIVQHPRGEYKRLGVRSNLVTAATPQELRYFTDTDIGSSGSPVFDDNWRVVALHRGAVRVTDVSFQGKSTAYVNFGSQITAVLADLGAKRPEILAQLKIGPGAAGAPQTV